MRYVGSKKRIAKRILSEILSRRGDRDVYWEPFCGGLNSFSMIAPSFQKAVASDAHPDLIELWSALHSGWAPPETISEQEYADLKSAEPSAIRGLAGFGGSFGGKWFGGYARGGFNSDGAPRDHQAESIRAASSRMAELKGTDVQFKNAGYDTGQANERFVVYCDPPYQGTLGYRDSGGFDHDKFWSWCRDQAKSGALVLVSEYSAPEDFTCIAEFDHRMSVAKTTDRRSTQERLFVKE